MKLKFVYVLFFILFLVKSQIVQANSSFDELARELSVKEGISKPQAKKIVASVFKLITERMLDDKGTSIPDFGRFYVQEKQKEASKDKDGFTYAPRMVRVPRCSLGKELRKILEKR